MIMNGHLIYTRAHKSLLMVLHCYAIQTIELELLKH